jgi:hypothetical protein
MATTQHAWKSGVTIAVALIGSATAIIVALLSRTPAEANAQEPAVAATQPQQPPAELEQLRGRVRAAEAERDRLQRERDAAQARREPQPPATARPRRRRREREEEEPEAQRRRQPERREEQRERPADGEQDPPKVRQERPKEPVRPPAPQTPKQPKLYDVSVTVEMENVRLHDANPLLTRCETVTIRAGGQTMIVEVTAAGRTRVGTFRLPEGTHKYVATARAEGRWWPGSGHQPRQTAVNGGGADDLVVRGDSSFVLRRAPSRDGGYEVRLEPEW